MSVNTIEIPAGLGLARPDPERLRQIVARALQVPTDQIVGVADIEVEKVAYDIGTPSTHALLRCRGTAALDDATTRPWSAFVKVLQSVWAWEFLDQIPEPFRADLANNLPWRAELDGYTPNMLRALPAGLRQPRLFGVVEIDEWHVALWVEDVEVSSAVWGLAMFARAARLLGRLAARRPVGCDALIAPSEQSAQPGFVLRYYTGGRVRMGALPQLVDDALWAHPTVAAAVEATGEHALRADLVDASEHLDAWLDLLDALPQTYAHGDASPQNLLVPASEPGTFVIIDWGFNCPLAVGFDLGQLLVGLAHAGELGADALPGVLDAIVPAFHEGLVSEGFVASLDQVRTGFAVSLVVRSMFTALPFERLAAPASASATAMWVERIRLTRFLLDLSATL